MAKTAERKLEVARRIRDMVVRGARHGPELLIFDALTFTLTTGDEEWKPSAVETIEGIRRDQGRAARRAHLARRLQRLLRHRPAARARCSTPSSCTTAWRPGSTWRWSTRTTSRRTARSSATSARSPTTSSSTAARTRWSASSPTSRPRPPPRSEAAAADPTADDGARGGACTGTSCAARGTAWRPRSTRAVEKLGAVPTLNDVLLPAMKEVGDKFGAGELILPFVLQSAEVMKRAVARLEQLPGQARGLHQGHGRAGHGVRRRARHRQVARQHDPHQQRLHGGRPRQAGADRDRSWRRLRSTTRRPSGSAPCSSRPPSRCRSACRSCTRTG